MSDRAEHEDTIRVLHVDDQPDFAEMTTAFLERESDRFDTETVSSASEGLNRLAESTFDCVISDYEMPGQNGVEFLRAVREEWPDLPFILFTGKGSETVASDAISAGVTDYLQKSPGNEQYELLANRILNSVGKVQAEQQIKTEQKRFKTLFDHLSQTAVEVRYEADEPIVRQVNAAFENAFGYESETMIGDSLDTHIVPDNRTDEAVEINEHVQSGGSLDSREVVRQTTDGLRKFLLQNAVYDDGSGGFAIYTDIADRSERKELLERNRDLLRHTQQLAKVGGWEADLETGEQRWTKETYNIHDLDPAEESDPSVETAIEFYHPDDQSTIQTAIENCRTHGKPYDLELRLITAENDEKWVRTTGERIHDGDDIIKLRGAIQDITAQKEREKELRLYEQLVRHSPELLVIMDEEMTVKYQSPPSPLLEWEPLDVVGENPSEEIHPDDHEKLMDHFARLKDKPDGIVAVEFRARDVDGDWRWIESRGQNFTDSDPIEGILAVMRDVTQRKQQEQRLVRERDRLDEFTSIVSHDLRSPLNVAKGRTKLAASECDSEHLTDVQQALTRMEALIEDSLALARQGKVVGETTSVDLEAIVARCWETTSTTEATLEIEGLSSIQADADRLPEVFENLFRNAVDHGGEGVTITVGEVDTGFYIEDDGSGISDDNRDEVFETGYSTSEEGVGFGLNIVKQIVEAHGWEIHVTDSADGGARFEITGVEKVE
ncbi:MULTISPECIES: PAS domain S-box protein [unclassified Halorubrum]|uniref:PAS domain S-box protein n=1 Tax=unclassified Halorubrum TaxID=2642239 RepID=UPI000B99B833|nr:MULTISPECIES: PAS domain S-box protein [unclassified Halorubrum]